MRLAIGAGFLAAIGLFAFGPAGAAYATVDSPDPSPSVVTEESSEEASEAEMTCMIDCHRPMTKSRSNSNHPEDFEDHHRHG